MLLLYNIFIRLYFWGVLFVSLWNKKAAAWKNGRTNLFVNLTSQISKEDKIVWIHCSSAGEFEQGKPIIEEIKRIYPAFKILISFFSPSGLGVAQNYREADFITYLPLDTRKNAEAFIRIVNPQLVVFIKYEFWFHHLSVAAFHHIPVLLASAVFREEQAFFKPYGQFYRQMLFLFRHLFVQDEKSLHLLQSHGINHSSISGDTRFDRVKNITSQPVEIDLIQAFVNSKKVIVAGSTWRGDEELLATYVKNNREVKLVLVPHEINQQHIDSIVLLFENSILYSSIRHEEVNEIAKYQVLVIDTVGLLSRLYYFATLAYVGGGFTKDGIHNILEAAVWGKPVFFGPNFRKYREAEELLKAKGAFSVRNKEELKKLADELFMNKNYLQAVSDQARNYIQENTGATSKILAYIQEKRLLTR